MTKLLAALLALAVLIGLGQARAADDPVTCIQTYLSHAGYVVGAIDGNLGKATLAIGTEFATVYPELSLPKLTKANAGAWCNILKGESGQQILKTRFIPPTDAPPETISESGGLNFDNPLVTENYENVPKLKHGFLASLRPDRVVVDVDPARVHSGDGSIRMHLLPGDCGWTTHRGVGEYNDCDNFNERVETTADPSGIGEVYYGFSVMLGRDFIELPPFPGKWPKSEINLYQWYQHGVGACFDIVYNTRRKQLGVTVLCPTGAFAPNYLRVMLEDATPDVWHEFVVHANWSRGPDGFFRMLQNGKMVMNYSGPTLDEGALDFINEHPQVYAYGAPNDHVSATMHYRTGGTVWFDDMVRSETLARLHDRYRFQDAALADFGSALPLVDLDPGLIGDLSLYAPGEAEKRPPGTVDPGARIPASVLSGFKDAQRWPAGNAKAYGMVVAPEADGVPTLRLEVRRGDCGFLPDGSDACDGGQESVLVANGVQMTEGQHVRFSWRMSLSPTYAIGGTKSVNLFSLSQSDGARVDRIFASTEGLRLQRAKDEPVVLMAPTKMRLDQYHDVVVDVVWSKGKKGSLSVSIDGDEVYTAKGRTLFDRDARVMFGVSRDGGPPDGFVANFQHVLMAEIE